jgi:hypothetical protein
MEPINESKHPNLGCLVATLHDAVNNTQNACQIPPQGKLRYKHEGTRVDSHIVRLFCGYSPNTLENQR